MKKCPYCAEEIQDEAIKCRFCGSMLTAEPRFDAPPQHADADVLQLIHAGKKIEAIKVVREKKNLGLKEAKDYVESLERGAPIRVSPATVAGVEPKKTSPIAAVFAMFVVLVTIGWFGGLFSTTDSNGRFVMPQSIAAPKPVVTMAEFNRLENGMTYEAVSEIIGASGQLLSSSDIAGYTTVMYSWTNANGSNMNAMFQNGKLVQKAQFGLP